MSFRNRRTKRLYWASLQVYRTGNFRDSRKRRGPVSPSLLMAVYAAITCAVKAIWSQRRSYLIRPTAPTKCRPCLRGPKRGAADTEERTETKQEN